MTDSGSTSLRSVPTAQDDAMTTPVQRLEAAEVGSRELDAEICILLQYGGLNSEGAVNVRTDEDWDGDLLFEVDAEECCNPIPEVTTSLDAALALAERIRWRARSMDASIEGRFSWCLQSLDPHPGVDEETGAIMSGIDFRYGTGKTPALALCAAILKASGNPTSHAVGIANGDEPKTLRAKDSSQ